MKSVIRNILKEQLESNSVDEKFIADVSEFVSFCKEFLGITDKMHIELHTSRDKLTTTAAYNPSDGCVMVYVKGRALVDVCRSIAHELVHHKQNCENRITNAQEDGQDGSDIENEANSMAGIIMRKYGKLKPEIYE
jgi:hypothetical protein